VLPASAALRSSHHRGRIGGRNAAPILTPDGLG